MPWNCSWKGDYPEDVSFCTEECPHLHVCKQMQTKRYPLESWRLVAEKGTAGLWMEQAGVKKK